MRTCGRWAVGLAIGVVLAGARMGWGADPPPLAQAAAKVVLEQCLAPGQYEMVVVRDYQQGTTLPGGVKVVDTNVSRMVFGMEVLAPDNSGSRAVHMTWRKFRQEATKRGGAPQVYDSEKAGTDPPSAADQLFGRMMREKMTLHLGPHDAFQSIDGMELMRDLASAGRGPNAAEAPRVVSIVATMGVVLRWPRVASGRPVGPGDTWEARVQYQAGLLGQDDWPVTCRLEGYEETPAGRIALISWEGALKTDNPPAAPDGTRPFRRIDLKCSGRQRYNMKTSLVEKQSAESVGPMDSTPTVVGEQPVAFRLDIKDVETQEITREAGRPDAGAPAPSETLAAQPQE